METYDALSAARELRQILAPDKLSLGFLIGAGCPCAVKISDGASKRPLVPDVVGLTRKVVADLNAAPDFQASFRLLHEGLQEDGYSQPNIEQYLTRVRSLADVAGNSVARGLSKKQLADLDGQICVLISKAVECRLPSDSSPFHDLASFIGSRRTTQVELFTTNYDLLLEQAMEDSGVPFFDGFCGSDRAFFDQKAIETDVLPVRWVRLRKLHGSINWRSEGRRVFRTKEKTAGTELLIHPSHRKYDDSRKMPYLIMMDRLRHFIRNEGNPVCLFVNGYSWSDDHLNEVIASGLSDNPKAVCLAIQRSELSKYSSLVNLAARCSNLSVYAKDSATVGHRTKQWSIRPTADLSPLNGIFETTGTSGADSTSATFLLGDFAAFGTFLTTFSTLDTRP